MKNQTKINKIRASISHRLSIWMVLFAGLIFITVIGYMFYDSHRLVREEAHARAELVLDNTIEHVGDIFTEAEKAVDNMDWIIHKDLDTPKRMFEYSIRILRNNPMLYGCSIAFEPDFYPEYGKYFSVYSNNGGHKAGKITTHQEGSDEYNYFDMDWYRRPKESGEALWIGPYVDYDPVEGVTDRIISYGKPLYRNPGQIVGVLSVDISLPQLSQAVTSVRPYPHSYTILLDREGTFLAHPDTTRLYYQNLYSNTNDRPDPELRALGEDMVHGRKGLRSLQVDGEDCYVYYGPLSNTGISVALVCPREDIYGNFFKFRLRSLLIVGFGMLVMLIMTEYVIRRVLSRKWEKAADQEEIPGEGTPKGE